MRCGYGSGFKSTPFTTENRAVFAPMPSARVQTTTAVNPGDLARIRKAYRTSCTQTGHLLTSVRAVRPRRTMSGRPMSNLYGPGIDRQALFAEPRVESVIRIGLPSNRDSDSRYCQSDVTRGVGVYGCGGFRQTTWLIQYNFVVRSALFMCSSVSFDGNLARSMRLV